MSGKPKTCCPRVLDALRQLGKAGGTSTEIGALAGRNADNCSCHLVTAEKAGLVGWWPEPIGKTFHRRRWWLTEFRPKRKPEAQRLVPIQVQTAGLGWRALHERREKPAVPGVQKLPGWTHDARFQCAPGEQPQGAGFAALGMGRYLED